MRRAGGNQINVGSGMQAAIDQKCLMTSGHQMLQGGFGHCDPILQQSAQPHQQSQISANRFLDGGGISGA